jgi:hypothetical protein
MNSALIAAEGKKQAAFEAAKGLPMPAHQAAIRQAERQYCLDLAAAADQTGGLVDAKFYHSSARWHE